MATFIIGRISMDLKTCRLLVNRLSSEYRHAESSKRDESSALDGAKQNEMNILEAQKLCQEVAEGVQGHACAQISKVITECLRTTYDDSYEFKILFEQKRGRTEATPVLLKGEHVLRSPLEEAGGGVCDIVAFAGRVANLMLSRPRKRLFLLFDEPFANLHGAGYREKITKMIETLNEKMGIQFLILTQDDTDLRIGKVIDLDKS